MREMSRTVPAPAELGLDVIGVAAGSDLELRFRLESVSEGVLVSGTATAELSGECARCLDPLTSRLEVDFQQLYVYPGNEIDDEDDETGRLIDDCADLEPVIRDAVVLALPLAPLCRDDCAGLCPDCGARLDDVGPTHAHEIEDSRWSALRGLDGLAEQS
jgi:uncharacterized protein